MSNRQAERSETTRRELLRVARELFAERGYEGTTLDEVAERTRLTKGALYHHFRDKRELFRAVFEELEKELCDRIVIAAAGAGPDVWEQMRRGVQAFLDAAAGDPAQQRIVLIDGPSVLGWDTWREIDEQYGFGITKASLQSAMDAGVIKRRPVDPLAHIFLAALSEAAIQIARADDPSRAMDEMSSALWALVESLRTDNG
jgi:AcrR family transcriptional regulator